MATDEELEEACEDLNEKIAEVADDTDRWSQEQSAEIFEDIASVCTSRARTIRKEMANG